MIKNKRSAGSAAITAEGGWRRLETNGNGRPAKKRLICAVDGLEKRGKNHFSFTAPSPIGILSLDLGLEGVIEKFQSKKEIWVAEHRVNTTMLRAEHDIQEVANIANQAWNNIMRDYDELLTSGARTGIIDTGTELWEILRLARFGKLDQVKPHHYGPVNAEYREVIRKAFDTDMNLILLHKMKDEYVNDKRNGEVKRAGFSDTGFLVQVIVQCWRDDQEKAPDCFHATVTDCRHDPGMNGFDMQGELASFSTMAQLIFPDTGEDDWR